MSRPARRHAQRTVRPRSLLAAVVLVLTGSPAVLATELAVAPAHAHTDLLASSPAAGETVSPDTEELMLSFAEEVVPGTVAVSVVGPDGKPATDGEPVVEGALVRVRVRLATTGSHTVAYRVMAADGHVVTGGLDFGVTTGAIVPAVTLPAAAQEEPARSRPLPWVLGSALLLLVVAGLHTARRRRSGQWSACTPRAPESVSSDSRAAAASSS